MVMKWAVVVAFLAAALPACADEVVLKNGAVFTGVVREDGERVVIEVDFGSVTFRRSEVRSVTRTDNPIKDFEQKLKAAKEAKDYYELGLWARDKGLQTRAADLFDKAISLDPDHEAARRAAGYEKFEGRWLRGDDLKIAQGYEKYNGKWMKREMVAKLLEDEKQIRIENQRNETAERLARLDNEIQLAKIAVERERLELEKQRSHYFYSSPFIVLPCRCKRGHNHGPVQPVVVGPAVPIIVPAAPQPSPVKP